jgi:alkylation response protein AidB-like acyl-CoA dehydrogenase
VPIAVTEEQRALADAVRAWARRAAPVATARAMADAPERWRTHWPELASLGVLGIGADRAAVTELAVALEAGAETLVPGPLLGTALAVLLLGDHPLATALLAGERTAALALDPADLEVRDGAVLTGAVRPVAAAANDALILLADGRDNWYAVDAASDAVKALDLPAADFSRGVGEIRLAGALGEPLPGLGSARVRELAATLAAAEASGIAGWCLRTATEYAKVREQFGRPIGSFQAIKHMCAEMLCRAESAAATAWDAARAAGDAGQHPLAAAVAASVALDAAVENAKDCIQILGGVGYTWEHDAHLYLRRAIALRQALGGTDRWRIRAAQLTASGLRRVLSIDLSDQHRAEVRAQAERIAGLPPELRRAALADSGYLVPHWPAPYGLGAAPELQLLVDAELDRAGVTRPDLVIAGWAIPTILAHGTPAQVERFVAPTLRGELVWCQLFSEPEAGSDLASLRTRAARVDGGWRLTGQKVWTSVADRADWGICLARTNPEAPKHRGITYFLVDMNAPGIEVRPLREITGEALFNEVFLDGVFVPDEMVVGDVDGGWPLARTTLAHERVAMGGRSSIGDAVERLVGTSAERGLLADPGVAARLGALVAAGLTGSLLDLRTALARLAGRADQAGSSVRKLIGVRHRQAVAETALDLLGPDGLVAGSELHAFLNTRCLTIAGGTSQVLLTLAAERILGLPREP